MKRLSAGIFSHCSPRFFAIDSSLLTLTLGTSADNCPLSAEVRGSIAPTRPTIRPHPREQHMPTATADTSTDTRPQLMLRRPEAAAACGKGTSTWDRMTAAALNPAPIKLGGTVLWSAEELREWCRHGCPPRAEWEPLWEAIIRRTSK